jgi:hypothetical protein
VARHLVTNGQRVDAVDLSVLSRLDDEARFRLWLRAGSLLVQRRRSFIESGHASPATGILLPAPPHDQRSQLQVRIKVEVRTNIDPKSHARSKLLTDFADLFDREKVRVTGEDEPSLQESLESKSS